jgi:hypothetical protein
MRMWNVWIYDNYPMALRNKIKARCNDILVIGIRSRIKKAKDFD